MAVPSVVILLCGKRKSGKDYIASKLQETFGDTLSTLRLSKPLKEQFAEDHGLDLTRLMDSSGYKETYRQDMIRWGESVRNNDPDHFCRLSTVGAAKPVWLVCDARRPTDMAYFKKMYPGRTLSVRVEASDCVRVDRGWVFTSEVDDAPSECALDDYKVDLVIMNNGDSLAEQLERLHSMAQDRIRTNYSIV